LKRIKNNIPFQIIWKAVSEMSRFFFAEHVSAGRLPLEGEEFLNYKIWW